MNDLMKPAAADQGAEHLMALIKQLIKEQQYEGVALLFTSNKEAERNLQYLPKIAMDLYHDICLENLNDKVNQENASLYGCAEELLKIVATHAPAEELLLELLELIEESKSEFVFTSSLRALQIVLLRQGDEKPRALEWSLNSIYNRLEDLPVPDYLKEGYDSKQQALLEQDDQIQSLLMHYITVGLFYDPLINAICSKPRDEKELFRPVGITRRNVLCCFLIELLGKPLSLLDLTNDEERKTNTYSLQCAKSLTQAATKCITDPLFLLSFVESRARFKRREDEAKGVHEMSSCNIFLINEKLPLDCLAIYYYMVFVEGITKASIPLVYHPLYILETCLYLIYELLLQDEPALHEKSLLLLHKLLEQLKGHVIDVSSLDLEIHKSFCTTLCNIVGYSSHTQVRQLGLKVLRQYILSFVDEAKYLILKNLMKSVNHHGLVGYLATLYKDLVAEALKTSSPLPASYSGNDFRYIFLNNICHLPQGVETDLLENSDRIVASLNTLRFIALKDVENRTGFWNFAKEIEESYLNALRKALDLSVAHFKAELHNVETGVERPYMDQLNLLDIDVQNDKQSKLDLQFDKEKQISILNQNLCTFDLMRSLLSRACECLESAPRAVKSKMDVKHVKDVENV
ncbi:glomulin-like [Lucilia sericata]|uniref:glomulin n=1 Tax=Lucilia sericata TaxID=13632 RepID=UPI0018A85B45|nr:glomulin [Lucilia sericata]XP_037827156.1 glomulin-like [Lucilia sericata]